MDLNAWNDRIEKNSTYRFLQRHDKIIKIIEGVVIILLLISLNSYLFKDRTIKEEIRDSCGWEKGENYYCICDKNFAEPFKKRYYEQENFSELFDGIKLGVDKINNVSLVGWCFKKSIG